MVAIDVHPIIVDGGDEWFRCSVEEAAQLIAEELIGPCDGSCPKGVYHPEAANLPQVQRRLEVIRREKAN